MPRKPFFSVIIPLYNKELYIKDTLHSVLNQTFNNFEVIIINDGSTDKGFEIVKSFNDSRLKFFEQKNQGLSASRNKGISLSTGKVIALLDADDIWHYNFLETISNLYNNFPEASVYGTDYLEKYSDTNILETKKNINRNQKKKSLLIEDFFLTNKYQSIVCQSSIAFHKEKLANLRFNESIDFAEDVDFYIQIFMNHKLAYYYSACVTVLTNVPNQITKLGIKNKIIPHFDNYERKNPNNNSLKLYLDSKRYMYAVEYRLVGDKKNFEQIINKLDLKNLTLKQKILLKSPLIVLKLLKAVKKLLLKFNIRITSYGN